MELKGYHVKQKGQWINIIHKVYKETTKKRIDNIKWGQILALDLKLITK